MLINDYLDQFCNAKNTRKTKELELKLLTTKYFNQLLIDIMSMLEYENVPEGFNPDYLELFRLMDGKSAVVKNNNDIVPIKGSFSGDIGYYGYGSEFVGTDLGGNISFEGKVDKDCALFKNNALMIPDAMNILEYAEMFAQVKVSKKCNVIFARYLPLFKVANQKTKEALKVALKDIEIGNVGMILGDNIESYIEGIKDIERIDITEVRNNDMLQYIDKFEDDLMRGFYSYYGHSMNVSTKLAQQSVSEVEANESVAAIYPLQRLKYAKMGCEAMNKLFGTNMSVRFSEAWESRHNDLITDIKEGSDEDVNDDDISEQLGQEMSDEESPERD